MRSDIAGLAPSGLDDIDAMLEQRSRAVRAAASAATDVADFLLLLDALGLSPQEGRRKVSARSR